MICSLNYLLSGVLQKKLILRQKAIVTVSFKPFPKGLLDMQYFLGIKSYLINSMTSVTKESLWEQDIKVVEPLSSSYSIPTLPACNTGIIDIKNQPHRQLLSFYEVRWSNLDMWNFLWIFTN